jgi:hypothetical protein
MKETWKRQRWLKSQHRVYCLGRSPVEGDPGKRAGALSYLLPEWSQPSLGEVRGDKW